MLSGSNDNTLKLWDFASGKLIKSLRGHGGWVDSAVFSPDGHSVLSGSHDNGIKLWSIAGYEEVRVLQGRVLQGHTDAVLSAAFSRDGKQIVTASRDRTAKMWDFATGKLLQDIRRRARLSRFDRRLLPRRQTPAHRRRRQHDPHLGPDHRHATLAPRPHGPRLRRRAVARRQDRAHRQRRT